MGIMCRCLFHKLQIYENHFWEKIAIPLALKKPNYEIDMAKTHFPTIISEYGTFRILFSS